MFQFNKQKIVVANWKMNPNSYDEVVNLLNLYIENINNNKINLDKINFVVAPPAVYMSNIYLQLKQYKINKIYLSAQNICWETHGAFTGELSANSFKSIGCELVIIGHSERRTYNQETNELIAKKFLIAINSGLIPIVCVGENKTEFGEQKTWQILEQQLFFIERFLEKKAINSDKCKFLIAYEPVWAIGTGVSADLAYIAKIADYIKQKLDMLNLKNFKILYGGSVNANNAKSILQISNIDGILVGGSSFDIEQLTKICNY